MRTKLGVAVVTIVMGFLLATNPMVADAARLITGKDIKDGSVTGRDIKNGSLAAADFEAGSLPEGPQGPPGVDGTDGTDGTDGVDGAQGEQGEQGPRGPGAASLSYRATTNDSGAPLGVVDNFRYAGSCSYNAGTNSATASLTFFRPGVAFGAYGLTTTIDNTQAPQYSDVALDSTNAYLVSATATLGHTVRAYAAPLTLTFNGTPDNRTQEISVRVSANVSAAGSYTCRITGTVTPSTVQQ